MPTCGESRNGSAAAAAQQLMCVQDLGRLRLSLQQMSEAKQAIVIAVYDLDETGDSGAAHAQTLGCSRSRVSRIHRGALDELRHAMNAEVAHG